MNQESGVGERSEICTSLLCNFPLTSVPPHFYYLACVIEIVDLLIEKKLSDLSEASSFWTSIHYLPQWTSNSFFKKSSLLGSHGTTLQWKNYLFSSLLQSIFTGLSLFLFLALSLSSLLSIFLSVFSLRYSSVLKPLFFLLKPLCTSLFSWYH